MALSPAQRIPLSETVADQLRQALDDGTYPAGSKLPTEAALTATMGVGRTTIREAMRILVNEGRVESRQGSGVYATGQVPLGQRLSTAALVEVFHARNAIETYAAGLACTNRDDADLTALEEALAHRDELRPRTREFAARDILFHKAVVAASKNTILLEMFTAIEPRLIDASVETRFLDRAEPERAERHVRSHYALIEAIRSRDVEQAREIAEMLQDGAIQVLERESRGR
ncbi:FCD domain-containing protein [uncultured Leifsonia sp.]|uniref:FadR/GntR family transcriptional regulator n=1 Tax=Leifsonia sp. TaxID=1870902 RepID=UPI0028D67B9D|nr:FCD domain-containing protein [uncultured Leifsonia sp.]